MLVSVFKENEAQDVVCVAEKFSVFAFVFTVIWLFWHRLWGWVLAYLAAMITLSVLVYVIGLPLIVEWAIGLGAAFLLGLEAPNLRRSALLKRGIVEAAVISAPSQEEAERRYWQNQAVLA